MKTKIIPFDLETAKKIQSGEIEGRIILEFNSCPVRIICLDKKSDTNKVVGLIEKDGIEYLAMYSENGVCTYIDELNSCYRNRLLIELSEESSNNDDVEEVPTGDGSIVFLRHKKHDFKTFDKVLVRELVDSRINNSITFNWLPAFFQRLYIDTDLVESKQVMYVANNLKWRYCIPYEGNEHLVGTR